MNMKMNLLVALSFAVVIASSFGQTTIQFSQRKILGSIDYVVPEDGVTAFITVERSGDTNGAITVDYTTSNGTATAGNDYVAQVGTITFAPGQTNQTFTIPIHDDGLVEMDETLNLTLSNPSTGASLGNLNFSTLTILDNERPGSLDTSFTVDSSFNPRLDLNSTWVFVLALQTDGKALVIVHEYFSNSDTLHRINPDGSFDTNFVSNSGGEQVVLQPDGRMLVAWSGDADFPPWGIIRHFIRLNEDGSIDPSFNPANSNVDSMALQPDGKVIITGGYRRGSTQPPVFARLNADGSLDESFIPVDAGLSRLVVLQPDGKVLIQGTNGSLVRLNSDGSLDGGFAQERGVGAFFAAGLLLQADGKVLVQGNLNFSDGSSRLGIFRVNSDGSLDLSFELDGRIYAGNRVRLMALQGDGKILVIAQLYSALGASDPILVRLNPDGTLDGSFDTGGGVDGRALSSIAVQADGQLLIAGAFTSVSDFPQPGIARLNGDGKYIKLSPPTRLPNNEVRVTITSQPGKSYVLQASSNLVDWVLLGTNTAAGYSLDFQDAAAMNFSRRFYQALLLSP
jgi:uncharacterized delta-60 repeat protein